MSINCNHIFCLRGPRCKILGESDEWQDNVSLMKDERIWNGLVVYPIEGETWAVKHSRVIQKFMLNPAKVIDYTKNGKRI